MSRFNPYIGNDNQRPQYPYIGSSIAPERSKITVLSDMEDLSVWNPQPTADTANKVSGTQSGKWTSVNNATTDQDFLLNASLVGKHIEMSVYIDNIDNLDAFYIMVYQDGNMRGWTIHAIGDSVTGVLEAGWNQVRAIVGQDNLLEGTVSRLDLVDRITKVRIRVRSTAGTTVNVSIDRIVLVESPLKKGIISFGFDDADASPFGNGLPLFNKYHVPATYFVITDLVDTASWITTAQLKTLSQFGWSISPHHKTNGVVFTTLTLPELRAELRESQKWMADRGFSARCIAYPTGAYNDAVIDEVSKYYEAGRTIGVGGVTCLPLKTDNKGDKGKGQGGAYKIPSYHLTNAEISNSSFHETVALVAKQRMVMTTYTHSVGSTAEITKENMEAAIQISINAGLDVITIDDLIDLNTRAFYRRSGWQETLSGSATVDIAEIAAGAIATFTITVTGAEVGDTVYVGPPSTIEAGLTWSAFVSVADTVTVRVHNTTAQAVDPAEATWTARVVH